MLQSDKSEMIMCYFHKIKFSLWFWIVKNMPLTEFFQENKLKNVQRSLVCLNICPTLTDCSSPAQHMVKNKLCGAYKIFHLYICIFLYSIIEVFFFFCFFVLLL